MSDLDPIPLRLIIHPKQPVETDLRLTDGVFVKSWRFAEAGMIAPQHSHAYDHVSICAKGSARVEADGAVLGVVSAGEMITIRAGVHHLFVILEPDTVIMCVHNTANTGGEIETTGDVPVSYQEV